MAVLIRELIDRQALGGEPLTREFPSRQRRMRIQGGLGAAPRPLRASHHL